MIEMSPLILLTLTSSGSGCGVSMKSDSTLHRCIASPTDGSYTLRRVATHPCSAGLFSALALQPQFTGVLTQHPLRGPVETAFCTVSWVAPTLEVGKTPTEVIRGRHVPESLPSAIFEFVAVEP